MSSLGVLPTVTSTQSGVQHLSRLVPNLSAVSTVCTSRLKFSIAASSSSSLSGKGLHISAAYNSNRYNNSYNDYYDDIVVDMDPEKMLKPGDPNTFQATIRKAMPVGYWVTMPSGREAFLPAQDLGFLGGLEKLRSIFQPGQEVTVRVVTRGGSGREILSLKKPDPNKPDPPPKPLRKEFEGGRRRRPSQYQ
ncbi:hypothetical protein KP509_04G015500 [Ceratopteris richardii]|uniref:S1 motif domain-containing protein n=2 Tax=Ceratopteris richardii TaxID=49495 RepID=A0A8T2UQH3_CERRI|nr:hypothetical protein KP509_04G015500 [Ceratopteris richardii]KAH7438452.1 hypothetical protein KP509_04G015500 [Ceratopteris richardii]